ncbi:MAG: MMPL family transporter [Lachnospiraceae bacterium]|nr:MMPL family transporter [Lachnospiraceae bacterium]
MKGFGEKVVRFRIPILIISLILLIPSVIGMIKTRVNYDILYYLPDNIETMEGQDILLKDFGKGAYAMFIAKDMDDRNAEALQKELEQIDGVAEVIWYNSIAGELVPQEILPEDIYDFYHAEDSTLMAVFFSDTTSADSTMDAIEEMRKVAGEKCFLSGMSAIVTDTKIMVENELFTYVAIAAVLALIVMSVTLDSFLVPVLFLLSIGMAILYNMGTNVLKGEISFITMALAAVLQLGVTMDYSIFLYGSYKEKKKENSDHKEAMAEAISATLNSVVGSSLTTVAGFVALCFMTFTLGLDLGIVMAKGVVIGVICCVTVLPSALLLFDRAIEVTTHKALNLSFKKLSGFVTKYHPVAIVVMILLWIPAIYGYNHMDVYYKLDSSLPDYLPSVQANKELSENYDMASLHMILIGSDVEKKDIKAMVGEVESTAGVGKCLGMDALTGSLIPDEVLPDEVTGLLKSDEWQLMLVTSDYEVATDEMNSQIEGISDIVKRYDPEGMVIGEAACTKDLIKITDKDFAVVNTVSIGLIFLLIMFVLKSVSLPVILVAVIELAIYINLGLCYYCGTVESFIASIVIGTIQLGATVDYAILMTNRYKTERLAGYNSRQAAANALTSSAPSIITSALGFFAATIGVGIYSDVDLISSLCMLLARGAVISCITVMLILPAMYILFDGVIIRTTLGMKSCIGKKSHKNNIGSGDLGVTGGEV